MAVRQLSRIEMEHVVGGYDAGVKSVGRVVVVGKKGVSGRTVITDPDEIEAFLEQFKSTSFESFSNEYDYVSIIDDEYVTTIGDAEAAKNFLLNNEDFKALPDNIENKILSSPTLAIALFSVLESGSRIVAANDVYVDGKHVPVTTAFFHPSDRNIYISESSIAGAAASTAAEPGLLARIAHEAFHATLADASAVYGETAFEYVKRHASNERDADIFAANVLSEMISKDPTMSQHVSPSTFGYSILSDAMLNAVRAGQNISPSMAELESQWLQVAKGSKNIGGVSVDGADFDGNGVTWGETWLASWAKLHPGADLGQLWQSIKNGVDPQSSNSGGSDGSGGGDGQGGGGPVTDTPFTQLN